MRRNRFGLILAALASVTPARGEEAPEPLPAPTISPEAREKIKREASREPEVEPIVTPEDISQAPPQPIPLPDFKFKYGTPNSFGTPNSLGTANSLGSSNSLGAANSLGASGPTITAVHEFDRPPLANLPGDAVAIRGTRFEVDVAGLDPTAQYRLLALFDGETIGGTDWVFGRDSHSIATQVGFPPGRYRLTVQIVRRDVSSRAARTPPVIVNYQPTYLREMRRLGPRDVTAVPISGASLHQSLEDEVQPRQIQVRFVGLDSWHVHMYQTRTNQFDLQPLIIPDRRSFAQGRLHQLKVTKGAYRLYPTLEIPRTALQAATYLARNALAVELTMSEVEYVTNGGMLTKVSYLPHRAEHPTRANCVETLVSRCPGDCQDPLAEAARIGTILAVLRLGDKDLE